MEKHVNAIFTKLDLASEQLSHRRVAAVLTVLRDAGLHRPGFARRSASQAGLSGTAAQINVEDPGYTEHLVPQGVPDPPRRPDPPR